MRAYSDFRIWTKQKPICSQGGKVSSPTASERGSNITRYIYTSYQPYSGPHIVINFASKYAVNIGHK